MTPEQERKLNEVYDFIQSLRNSASIPYDVDGAFRKRFITDINLGTFGIPDNITNAPLSSIPNPTGGTTTDSEARTAITSVISALETLGLIQEN